MSIELKKCPFCGGCATLYYHGCQDRYHVGTKCIVLAKCKTCKASGPISADDGYPDEDGRDWDDNACYQAAYNWNRRANEIHT